MAMLAAIQGKNQCGHVGRKRKEARIVMLKNI
jgi:hypothetical protein